MNPEMERRAVPRLWGSRQTTNKEMLQPVEASLPRNRGPEASHPSSVDEVQQLRRKLQELTDANLELEAFNATVSHVLCTPLTAINGYCQVLKELCRDQLDESSQAYLKGIYDGTLRMKELISSMLEFSRVTHSALSRERINLSEIAGAVTGELRLAAPHRSVEVRIAKGITGNGDPGLWRSVLDNLIGNAWKFSAGGEQTVIEFGRTRKAGKPVYFVRDNGSGFEMALADQLFAPFRRAPETGVEGHGIGLATVERIVRRHGGQVWAESAPGAGASFYFTME